MMTRQAVAGIGLFWVAGLMGCAGSQGGPPEVEPAGEGAEAETQSSPHERTAGQQVGTLDNDDITIRIRTDRMIIDLTTLSPEILQYATEDLQQTFERILENHLDELSGRMEDYRPFLVIYRAQNEEARYEPFELNIQAEGSLYRPAEIIPITANFHRWVLGPLEISQALYFYDRSIDLRASLLFEYLRWENSTGWTRVIARWEQAQARFRKG